MLRFNMFRYGTGTGQKILFPNACQQRMSRDCYLIIILSCSVLINISNFHCTILLQTSLACRTTVYGQMIDLVIVNSFFFIFSLQLLRQQKSHTPRWSTCAPCDMYRMLMLKHSVVLQYVQVWHRCRQGNVRWIAPNSVGHASRQRTALICAVLKGSPLPGAAHSAAAACALRNARRSGYTNGSMNHLMSPCIGVIL